MFFLKRWAEFCLEKKQNSEGKIRKWIDYQGIL